MQKGRKEPCAKGKEMKSISRKRKKGLTEKKNDKIEQIATPNKTKTHRGVACDSSGSELS